ncbi:xylose ABC transporter ATP-binding protein [Dyella sp. 7MK23]|uniref:Xylose ABC transporter ATP-binding protein n=2 Tax=Dyella acidiphila TaxID=2775866 RepID=A0ABR9GCZ3_9GAMM|nr:xylose ABC transporter ATP-binding protein [Dyella acidiphila]MBE1161922.1 xylose ABC transporter ATP-binding protein [Dyella acidiphila]
MSDYLFEMLGIGKSFAGVRALDGIDLRVRPGECLGLCGENGAGKSTLMKVLSGVYPHGSWEGEILWQGQALQARSVRDSERAGIVIIHQELMLVPGLSVVENLFLGSEPTRPGGRMDYEAMHARARALLQELQLDDVDLSLPVMHYGGGHQQLFEIAKALAKDARLLIFDEPTSSLTMKETEVLLGIIERLKQRGIACIYISHKLDEVARVCDTVSVIRDGRHVATQPMRELDEQRIIALMVGRQLETLYPRVEREIGGVVLRVQHMNCQDALNPARQRVKDVSFALRRGEILGLAGLVGAGRTELVSAIFGAYAGRSAGEVWMDGRPLRIRSPRDAIQAGMAMVPEDRKRHGIVPLLGVDKNITLATLRHYTRAGKVQHEQECRVAEDQIARMRVKTAHAFQPIVHLSGGNQQKALFARMLLTRPKVLILDEPTRGVDVGAKADIYRLIFELAAEGVSIIMVSSELPEILGVSDRVLVMSEGRLCGDFINAGLTQEQIMTAAIDGGGRAVA